MHFLLQIQDVNKKATYLLTCYFIVTYDLDLSTAT